MSNDKVLFVCTGNSCRSQMAEAFLINRAGDRFEVYSAGLEPRSEVHPLAVEVMNEIGIDISSQQPKSIKEYLGKQYLSWMIVVCDKAQNACPRVWPMLRENARLYWPFDDPAEAIGTDEEKKEVFRRVRDEIKTQIESWLKTLDN